jgi:hypothetical protein
MMTWKDEDGISCTILKSYGIFSNGKTRWNKEINLVSWNGRAAKLDLRNWQSDHKKCGKGIALTRGEAENLYKLLGRILYDEQPSGAKTGTSAKAETSKKTGTSARSGAAPGSSAKSGTATTAGKKSLPPKTLEPCYKELGITFGAAPEKCKSARNTLLKKYHPDKNPGNPELATQKTIRIKEAYDKIIQWWSTT